MSAGTVISGGFPGRIAQEVHPNQKCSGCLHYDGQAGRTGVCTIGLRPDNCGGGEAPDVSYAPIARGAGSYLPDMSNHGAHAPEVDAQVVGGLYGSGSTRPVTVHQVSLGEEHVHLVKSMMTRHADLQKAQCRSCSMRGTHGVGPANVGPQDCSCRPIEAATIVKAIVGGMSNAQKMRLFGARGSDWVESAKEWVRDVVKAGFKLPTPKSARSLGGKPAPKDPAPARGPRSLSDQLKIDDSGGHLRPIEKGTFYHESGRYEVTPAGGGQHHVDFHPAGGGAPTRLPGTFSSHKEARRAVRTHGERMAAGSGKVTPSTQAPTRQMRVPGSPDKKASY